MTISTAVLINLKFDELKALNPEFNAVVDIQPKQLISIQTAMPLLNEIEDDPDPELGGPAYLVSDQCICLYQENNVFEFAVARLTTDTEFRNPEWVDDFNDTISNVSGWLYLPNIEAINKLESKPQTFPVLTISQYWSGEQIVTRCKSQQELDTTPNDVIGWIALPQCE